MSDESTVRPEDGPVISDSATGGPGTGGPAAPAGDGIPAYARPAVRLLPGAMTEEPDDVPHPGRRRKATLITLGALGVAALLSLVFVGPTALRMIQQKDSTLTMPDRIGDLTRDDSDAAKDTAGYLMTALAADIDLDRTASAIYSDPAGGPSKSIMVFGGAASLLRPETEFDTVLKLMEDETGGVTALQTIDPGDLGGVVKCGSADSTEGKLAVCGWADNGSIALALFPNRTPTEATPLILQIRTTTLHR